MLDQLKKLDWHKVSLQTILGGAAVYMGAKQSGVPEGQAILAGVLLGRYQWDGGGDRHKEDAPGAAFLGRHGGRALRMSTAKSVALQFMQQYADAKVHEATGENDGDQINRFQEFAGGDLGRVGHPGDSYCLEALTYSLAKAIAGLRGFGADMASLKGLARPVMQGKMLLTASCALSMDDARQRGCWWSLSDIRAGKYLPMPGDWVFFCWNPNRGKGVAAENHVGVVETWSPDHVDTVEGNTTPGAGNDTTNNPGRFGGVYRKTRALNGFVLGVRALPESFS